MVKLKISNGPQQGLHLFQDLKESSIFLWCHMYIVLLLKELSANLIQLHNTMFLDLVHWMNCIPTKSCLLCIWVIISAFKYSQWLKSFCTVSTNQWINRHISFQFNWFIIWFKYFHWFNCDGCITSSFSTGSSGPVNVVGRPVLMLEFATWRSFFATELLVCSVLKSWLLLLSFNHMFQLLCFDLV